MKYLKNYRLFEKNIKIANYILTDKKYKEIIGNELYGKDEDSVKKYFKILEDYQINGGKIQRIIFSYGKPNIDKLGYSWTHINNDWKNYIQTIIDFDQEENKINGDEDVYLIIGETPPNNIAIGSSLEQYENNPEEEELTLLNDKIVKIISVKKIKTL